MARSRAWATRQPTPLRKFDQNRHRRSPSLVSHSIIPDFVVGRTDPQGAMSDAAGAVRGQEGGVRRSRGAGRSKATTAAPAKEQAADSGRSVSRCAKGGHDAACEGQPPARFRCLSLGPAATIPPNFHAIVPRRKPHRNLSSKSGKGFRQGGAYGNDAIQIPALYPCNPGHHRAGGPPFVMFVCTIPTEGAPSLRSLQGWAAMLPGQFCV